MNDYIIGKEERDIIITKFEDLKLLSNEVQSAHDNYLFAKYPDTDDEVCKEDEEWLTDIEERYEVMQRLKCDYARGIELTEHRDNILKVEENLAIQSNANIAMTKKNRDFIKTNVYTRD